MTPLVSVISATTSTTRVEVSILLSGRAQMSPLQHPLDGPFFFFNSLFSYIFYLFIYLFNFIFGCIGSSLLRAGFP